jgi:hypothetical protein
LAGVEALVWQDGRQQELERLSDRELLTMASREMLVAISLDCAVLRSELPSLIETKATETATLMNAIVAAFKAARDGLEQYQHLTEHADHAVKDSSKSNDNPLVTKS